ncbi:MAG: hypothetical protein OHK0029_02700 [Armatimonadaceae bacterium]
MNNLDDSLLFKQLREANTNDLTARTNLIATVRTVIDRAEWISAQIVRTMPQYTLHDQRHLLNVLGLMEELLSEEVRTQFTPLECALCILTAFTHDLGMALSQEEQDKISDSASDSEEKQAYLQHRARFSAELREIEDLRKNNRHDDAAMIEGHIRAEYVRRTHANDAHAKARLRDWFRRLKEETRNERLFYYGNYVFEDDLVLIGISHNQNTNWLREQFVKQNQEDAFLIMAQSERVNRAFPGLLLRLADYMDFDATRTPEILYRNFGVDNAISIQEWKKHLAITGRDFKKIDHNLYFQYEALNCQSPVVEKTIHEFVRDIDTEVKKVRDELRKQARVLPDDARQVYSLNSIQLPDSVMARVEPNKIEGQPCYIYHDLEFRLDQDEILQLLMGQRLYGDPTLCIRELLQNALDAVQMRDLRLKILREDHEAPVEPTDRLPSGEEFGVWLTWGQDKKGREFIRVRDNGIGMTEEVLKNFFAQVGKSYYRSPQFKREQELMRGQNLLATPISQFGIGVLSCFMIGDRLEVRTRPGKAVAEERKSYDMTLLGPGSLFWMKQGTLDTQGTEVTLYLKQGYKLSFDKSETLRELRQHFGYEKNKNEEEPQAGEAPAPSEEPILVDPALIAGQQVLYPLFPIWMKPENAKEEPLRLDERFHLDILYPLPVDAIKQEAQKWDCPVERLEGIGWRVFDWEDSNGAEATGSRIRLVYPSTDRDNLNSETLDINFQNTKRCTVDECASLFEEQKTGQEQVISIKGMRVEDIGVLSSLIPFFPSVGTRIWIDLRGEAAPSLTADRKTVLADGANWKENAIAVFHRWRDAIQIKINRNPSAQKYWRYLISWSSDWALSVDRTNKKDKDYVILNLLRQSTASWEEDPVNLWRWRLHQAVGQKYRLPAWDNPLPYLRGMPDGLTIYSHIFPNFFLCEPSNALVVSLRDAYRLIDVFASGRKEDQFYSIAYELCTGYKEIFNITGLPRDIDHDKFIKSTLFMAIFFHLLPEMLQPNLESSFPLLDCFTLSGRVGDGILSAPTILRFSLSSDGYTVRPTLPEQNELANVDRLGYDLVFPMTGVPLGVLRRDCPEWISERGFRALGTLPFFFSADPQWVARADELRRVFNVSQIYALFPVFGLWGTPFVEWQSEDWAQRCLSGLWIIETGEVVWAKGVHHVSNMPKIGKPLSVIANGGPLPVATGASGRRGKGRRGRR